jgi:hypothetical protein
MENEAKFLSDAWQNGNKVRLTITPMLDDNGDPYWRVQSQGVQIKEGKEYPIEGAVRTCQIVANSAKEVLEAYSDLVCRNKIVNIGGISADELDQAMRKLLKTKRCGIIKAPLDELTNLFREVDSSTATSHDQ